MHRISGPHARANGFVRSRNPGWIRRGRRIQSSDDGTRRHGLSAEEPVVQGVSARRRCAALAAGTVAQLPVKLRRTTPVKIEGTLLIVRRRRPHSAAPTRTGCQPHGGILGPSRRPPIFRMPVCKKNGARSVIRLRIIITASRLRPRPPASRKGPFRWFASDEMETVPLSTTARKALERLGLKILANLNE